MFSVCHQRFWNEIFTIKTLIQTNRQSSMLLNFPTRQNCCHKDSVHVLISHFGSVALIKENLFIITLIPSNPSTSASRRLFDIFLWHSRNSSSEPKQWNYSLRKRFFKCFVENAFCKKKTLKKSQTKKLYNAEIKTESLSAHILSLLV